jgi:hypothetical protein
MTCSNFLRNVKLIVPASSVDTTTIRKLLKPTTGLRVALNALHGTEAKFKRGESEESWQKEVRGMYRHCGLVEGTTA